ncbi:hypothetical protein OEZ85_001261 [Tetradesmus obliquus]|uniref:Uncharacterized protein n=1 Tax=Tetradesmus obliquus TaxID=3088 RepID=A0ABY8URE3_TETOB|nr:hypothetical protein OEZ85_001261 [Tetradesmus obliquus]
MAAVCSFEAWPLLGPSAAGHKLRLRIPDTAVIEDNVLKAWLYTDKQTGVLQATSRTQLSTAALLHKLKGQHAAYAVDNPQGWAAVAYFANCITRLVTAEELEELLARVHVGAVPEDAAEATAAGEEGLQLLALQAYVIPDGDARYITTFGGQLEQHLEGCATSTMADGRASVADMHTLEPERSSDCSCTADTGASNSTIAATGDGLAVPASAAGSRGSGAAAGGAADATSCSVRAAPGAVARAAAAALQVLVSHLDKAHGLRVQGMVAEFIKDAREQLWLVGLHSIAFDPQQSAGSAATFTERWGAFLAGAGPPPAPQLSQHTSYGRSTGSADCPSSTNAAPATATAQQQRDAAASSSGRGSAAGGASPLQQLNRQFFPLLAVDVSELPSCRPHSAGAGGAGLAGVARASSRPSSAPRCARAASPQLTRPSSCSPSRQRPASAAALSASVDSAIAGRTSGSVLGSCSILSNTARAAYGQAGGARYTSRNAASAARPGAGGNPTAKPTSSDSYSLWMQQPLRPSDSVTAQLACQLECAKEQLQRYADLAEAAQLQAASTVEQATQHVASVQQELLQLRHDAAASSRERRQLQQHVSELEAQRSSTGTAMLQLHQQLADVQEQLSQDRATMATMLRQHQQQKQQLEEDLGQALQQNGELRGMAQQLQARLEEEGEVVSALRAQLVDYKLQMEQMQLQAKKGRSLYNSSSTADRRTGATTPPGQLQGPAGSMNLGLSSSGAASASSSGMGPGAAGVSAATLDGAGGQQQQLGGGSWSQRSLQLPAALKPASAPLSQSASGKAPALAMPGAAAQASQSASSSGAGSIGDLLEVYGYYALLGGGAQVVADRLTMDLRSLGKLAFDLHISQDSKSLSAVEDVFYLLSDRRPCLALKAKTRPPSAEPLPSRPGHRASSIATPNMLLHGAAAAAAAASGSAYLGPGAQHALARAAASDRMGRDAEATSNAAAVAAAAMASALGPEVIVPEQFPEALIRLACVRYRWGVINDEYDWDDDDSSDYSDEDCEDDAFEESEVPVSPRMNRLAQQQKMQQQQQNRCRPRPRVLQPEGRHRRGTAAPAAAMHSTNSSTPSAGRSRSASPGRAAASVYPDYQLPTEADDLVQIVRTFLQHEVLKHARRNKLAGSRWATGGRRASSRP